MSKSETTSRIVDSPCDIIREPEPAADRSRTLLVLGLGGGGTSMVAGCLRLAGVMMGERLNEANNEDQEFHELIQARPFRDEQGRPIAERLQPLLDFIDRRNRDYALWGWKHPESHLVLPEVAARLRNPRFIYIFRDIYAVAQRNHKRLGIPHLESLRHSLGQLSALVATVERIEQPTMLVSYERCLRRPRQFLQQLSDFCGLGLSESDQRDLESFVRADRVSAEIDRAARERDRRARGADA